MKVGDRVVYKDVVCELVQFFRAPTPSGGSVIVAQVKRPRAGLEWCFFADLWPADDRFADANARAARRAAAASEDFR